MSPSEKSGTGPCWKASTAPRKMASPQTHPARSSAGSAKSTRPLHAPKGRHGGAYPAGCMRSQSRQGHPPGPPRGQTQGARPGPRYMRRRRSRRRSHGTFPYRSWDIGMTGDKGLSCAGFWGRRDPAIVWPRGGHHIRRRSLRRGSCVRWKVRKRI